MQTVTIITSDVKLDGGATRGFQVGSFVAQNLLLILVLEIVQSGWPGGHSLGLLEHHGHGPTIGCERASGGFYCAVGPESVLRRLATWVLQT